MKTTLLFCSFLALAQIAAAQRTARPASDAEGCVRSTTSCGATTVGQIAAGDCTDTEGFRYDSWQFQGTAGDFVTATLVALDPGFTNVALYLVPPIGDASVTPFIGGTGSATTRYSLATSGTWGVIATSLDAFAAGHYALQLECAHISVPSQECVLQPLTCGQRVEWAVSASSCRFSGATNRGYAAFLIDMKAGEALTAIVHSDDFNPAISIYQNGGTPLASAFGKRFSDVSLTYNATQTTTYEIVVYPDTDNVLGKFTLQVRCTASACTPPSITLQPPSLEAEKDSFVTLSTGVTGSQPISVIWFRGQPGDLSSPIAVGKALTLIADVPQVVWARAANGCGQADTKAAVVTIAALPSKRRAVRH